TLGVMNVSTKTGLFGQIAISGADSKLTVGTTLDLQHAASLDVTSGAAVTAQTLQLASMAGSVDVDVVGQGAKISAATVVAGGHVHGGGFTQGGTAQVVVGTGGILEYTNQLKIFAGSSVRLAGGELRAPTFGALSDPGFV